MYSTFLTVTVRAIPRRTAVCLLAGAVAMALPIAGAAQTADGVAPQTTVGGTSAAPPQSVINGTVITPQGEPLPNTAIRARNLLTGEVSGATTTGAGGQYSLNLNPGNYVIEILNNSGAVIGTSAFISAVAGVTLATAATVAATAGAALTAVSGATGLAAVLGTTAARSATFAAAAAGVAGVVVPEELLTASPSR